MRIESSRIATLLMVAATGFGCGGDGPTSVPVYTTLEVTPGTPTLFTVAPGNTVTLSVVPKDQNGTAMTGTAVATFSSDNTAVATVGTTGTVTAVAAGTASITSSQAVGSVTKSGTATVTVQDAPATATVLAPSLVFQPTSVDVRATGTVTWTFGAVPHNVTFTTAGAPANVPNLQDGSASRAFPTNGSFGYQCTIHPGMNGTVHVH